MNQAYLQQFDQHVRFSHIQDDVLKAAIIDSNDPYRHGNTYRGRVQNISSTLAWIDIGAPKPALLKCRNHQLHQGMQCIVRITRESQFNEFENKGPQVVLDPHFSVNDAESHQQKGVQFLSSALPTWLYYIKKIAGKLSSVLTIYTNDLKLFNTARDAINSPFVKLILKQTEPLPQSVDAHWHTLLGPVHPLTSGGHLLIEETIACTVFDLNTSGRATDDASQRLTSAHARLKFNQAASAQVFDLIVLRGLSGTIFIDFLRLNDWQLQQQLLVHLRTQAKSIKDLRVLGFTPGGWIEVCRPVKGPSLKVKANLILNTTAILP